jgi:hypothetical protein
MKIKLSISSHAFVRFSRAFSPHFDKGMQMQSTFLCFSTAHSEHANLLHPKQKKVDRCDCVDLINTMGHLFDGIGNKYLL